MSYEERFELAKTSLISFCKERITYNWHGMFDMWLHYEADMEFGEGYKNIFNEHFSRHMNSHIEELLFLSGKNIVYAIRTFIQCKLDADLSDIIDFTGSFLSNQLDDFDNWCDEISMAMYKETSEYELEFGNRQEGNSS